MTFPALSRGAVPAALLALTVVAACGRERPSAAESGGAAAASALDQQLGSFGMVNPAAAGHVRGAADAPVTVIEFGDFGCPYCARFALETYPTLHREYVETGKVRWLYVPFVMGTFPNGEEATRAAECATEQGEDAFWAMRDLLYRRQDEWKRTDDPETVLGRYAADVGIDTERFSSCYRENRSRLRVMAGNALAAQNGVRGTPTFFINGIRVQGALPLDRFRMVLDAMLP
jgi:protein-disulfide isomerase